MALYEKIRGTIETLFQFGLGRAQIKSQSTGELEVRNAADSAFAIMRGANPIGINDLTPKFYVDALNGMIIVSGQFDGNNPLPANTGTAQYLIVSTTGANGTIGQLVYDDGSGVGTATIVSTVDGRAVVVKTALSGGTVTFDPDSVYLWDAGTTAWVKVADVGGVTGGRNVIRYAITNAATQDSVTTIPANARVLRASIDVTTPYSGGATLSIGRAGSLALLQATTDNLPQTANTYAVNQDTGWGASALVVRVTIAGAPAAGAGVIVVEYANPSA